MTRDHRDQLYRTANFLALLTIGYNLLEGAVSIWFGLEDETLSLFGFGIDSFVEVISGIGIWHMVRRIRSQQGETVDRFESHALRITGSAFFFLAASLVISAVISLYRQHQPVSTTWGMIIGVISISFMWLLIRWKERVGTALHSSAILADAACSRACLYLSVSLLLASAGYRITGLGSLDAAGALVIAWFSFREGREAMEKARGKTCSCACACK